MVAVNLILTNESYKVAILDQENFDAVKEGTQEKTDLVRGAGKWADKRG